MMTTTIERLWSELRASGGEGGQRRVDAAHPHDIYADYAPPDRPGLVVVCSTRPGEVQPLRSLSIASGRRADGRWALHLSLAEPTLGAVFAALCTDVIDATRTGVDPDRLASAVLTRIERWRALLLRDRAGLEESRLRGLIGELHVLDAVVLPALDASEAVRAWTGPLGFPQDFQLPGGERIEVKSLAPNATQVRINGLDQLDADAGPIRLLVVRMQRTGAGAPGRVTAPALIAQVRGRLADEPAALFAFDDALAAGGWHEHPDHDEFAVLLTGIDTFAVDEAFPALTPRNVPAGIVDADYIVELPQGPQP